MKEQISQAISDSIEQLITAQNLAQTFTGQVQVTRTKDPSHGDYATNIALVFAKQVGKNPREFASALVDILQQSDLFEKVEMAGPGFINFFIAQKDQSKVLSKIFSQQRTYGQSNMGKGESIHIEYVSANPTGPLHVGHGRGAAYGATLANIYIENGYQVHREYYVNDAGRQMYEEKGALWFASSKLGDEKDRVVVRDNGQPTYFASDIAYHHQKFSQGYSRLINIWGADHHGYIARVRAALTALELDDKKLDVLLVQFANLYRGQEKLQMSTRSGEFVTLRALRKEVGADAARFFYVMRKSEQHLDFDLELATSKSNEYPVYYVQYAHARICSVLKQADIKERLEPNDDLMAHLQQSNELQLMQKLVDYEDMLVACCNKQSPHLLTNYLRELAQKFHGYYNETQFIVDSADITEARCCLIQCVRQVLFNGLTILGVDAPEKM